MTKLVKNYIKQYIDSITHLTTIFSIHKSKKYNQLCVNQRKTPKISKKSRILQDIAEKYYDNHKISKYQAI